MDPIQKIAILGAGSAGLMAALSLRRCIPALAVRVIRSPEIGVIGVGEGSVPNLRAFLLDYLRLDAGRFYQEAQPTWKLGLRLIWGPRGAFNYTFANQIAGKNKGFARPAGYYCEDTFDPLNLDSALMLAGKVAERTAQGLPRLSDGHAWHLENHRFVGWLESEARRHGVEITDGKVESVSLGSVGEVDALQLESGETVRADLYVDASGFRSELLGRALGEKWVSYQDSLFCDRAVIGGWERTTEPILPYTTAETMEAGWCWRIDHEHIINRGYVFSSQFLSDDDARAEFLRKNPKAAKDGRVVRFRSGRFERAGFVEPLEATSLMLIALESRSLAETLAETQQRPTPGVIRVFNEANTRLWDYTRDFLAIHYKFNTRLDSPFWKHAREHTPLGLAEPVVEFYEENGPSLLATNLLPGGLPGFGWEGFYALLVGQKAPTRVRHVATPDERMQIAQRQAHLNARAAAAMDSRELLALIRRPGWCWNAPADTPASSPQNPPPYLGLPKTLSL
jgi:tryptophan 7-halogenase